jgi:nucleoside-diphosphate-sugar epimerase
MKIVVTGATGFVGAALLTKLAKNVDDQIVGTTRRYGFPLTPNVGYVTVGEASQHENWRMALADADVVVHLAARAHVLKDHASDALAEFRSVNVEGTLALARLSVSAGVKRFVFVSSIGVNGQHTDGIPFDETSPPAPEADYAVSKLEAEVGLRALLQESAMELVVIRPPLVYAGNAPGNFGRLLKLVASGVPLPFASVLNERSLVALENLVDFVDLCIRHPAAAGELFLVADGVDVSTVDIIRYLAEGMGRKPRLVPFPDCALRWGAGLVGKRNMYQQLCKSLVIRTNKAHDVLEWNPPVSPENALRAAGLHFRLRRNVTAD